MKDSRARACRTPRAKHVAAALFGSLLLALPVSGQSDEDDLSGVDEIIVSITRRAENLQDVAATISVFNQESIKDLNIETVADVVSLIPNVQIKDGGNGAISIRGISQSFTSQPPVASHLNGIFQFTTATYGEFYDVESIEVQRGPVGVVYGRNATAGAINVNWVKPHSEWEAFGDASFGNFDRRQFRGGVNVPLLGEGDDRLNARFVVQRSISDATQRNLAATRRKHGQDAWTLRGTLRFQPSEDTVGHIRGYWSKDEEASGTVGFPLDPFGTERVSNFDLDVLGLHPFDPYDGLAQFQQSIGAHPLYFAGATLALAACTPVVLPNCGDPSISTQQDALQHILVNGFALGPNVVPGIIRNLSYFEDTEFPRNSETAFFSNAWDVRNPENEVYFVDFDVEHVFNDAPLLGEFSVGLIGGYYRQKELFHSEVDSTILEIINNFRADESENWVSELRIASENEGPVNWTLGLFWFDRELARDDFTRVPFVQTGNNVRIEESGYAPFANLTLRPFEFFGADEVADVEIFLGIRKNRDIYSINNDALPTPLTDGGTTAIRDVFRELTYDVGIKWFVTEDQTIYLKYSKGYKAGFAEVDTSSDMSRGCPCPNPIDEEVVRAWEAGWKSTWLDGELRTAWTGFYYSYVNLQVPKIAGFQVLTENAASATNWGVELEITWQPTSEFSIEFAGGYLNATFNEFCSQDDLDRRAPVPDFGCEEAARMASTAPTAPLQNLRANSLEDSPEWKFSLISRYAWDLGEMGTLTPILSFTWTDDYYRRPFNTSAFDLVQSSTRTDLRLLWRSVDERFTFEVFGENLEQDRYFGRTVTVQFPYAASGFGQLGTRRYGVRLGFRWGHGV
jgi:outer membrane receptor protein involved in Fe transport